MNHTIAFLVEGFFKDRTVKSAMSIIGKKSGEKRSIDAATADAATQILDGPKMAGLKMGLGALGIDIDDMIEKHGPVDAIQGLLQLGSFIGITPESLLSGGIGGLSGILGQNPQGSGAVNNPHLKT